MNTSSGASAVRRATIDDAGTLALLGAETFSESFGTLYPREDLDAFLREHHAPSAYARVLGSSDYALWLAEIDGEAVGYAQAGPCGLPHADVRPGDRELKRLYVRASAQGDRLGARLFEQALAWMQSGPPHALWLSVWSGNEGAQRFYARYGFEKAGEYDFIVGAQRDHEFIFRRDPPPP